MKRPRRFALGCALVAVVTAPALGSAAASPLKGSHTIASDVVVLQRFAPQSASTWWASFFLGGHTGWVDTGALHPPRTEAIYRTLDGGRTWRQLGSVPSECQLEEDRELRVEDVAQRPR
jgi:hypothetical protein